jgi:hypothetical protein
MIDEKVLERDQEAEYRNFKEQLLREKAHIKKLHEIESLKGELNREVIKLKQAKVINKKHSYYGGDDFFESERGRNFRL